MNRLIGFLLIATPFLAFGLMIGHQTNLGSLGVLVAAIGAAGMIIGGVEIIDNDRLS